MLTMSNGSVEVVQCVYTGPRPSFMFPESTHQTYTVLGVEAGSFEYEIADRQGRAAFGDLVFCPPGELFRRQALEDITFHVIYFHYAPDGPEASAQLPVGKVAIRDTARLLSTYTYLRKLQRRFGRMVSTQNTVVPLLLDLLFLSEMEREFAVMGKDSSDPLMQLAAGYMHRHLYEDMSMKRIAGKLGIGQSQLTRRFCAAYGETPVEYVARLRLEEVKRLLLETNETLDAIAGRCGFENGSYLSRVFSAKIGIAPSLFRHHYRI
ncbi:HTH-type transcriptional activator RhaS [Paenibacillus solanacearum]|uniref:HTH-type transcriptional activator RhaS n=1 Tax=Paenibacillus solanacearum TaxID=2048548 RepID=A0A916K305_9BACL|nr:AraC family transcriptional regulator [Paenibacillus solanacearum]CAG7635883.1 HTH-type transcriptional activator RhaS [Paenibacillus solanacearum]